MPSTLWVGVGWWVYGRGMQETQLSVGVAVRSSLPYGPYLSFGEKHLHRSFG